MEKLGIHQQLEAAKIQETVLCRHQEQMKFGILLKTTRQSLLKLVRFIGTSAALDFFRFSYLTKIARKIIKTLIWLIRDQSLIHVTVFRFVYSITIDSLFEAYMVLVN